MKIVCHCYYPIYEAGEAWEIKDALNRSLCSVPLSPLCSCLPQGVFNMSNKQDKQSTIRAYRSTIDRLNEYGQRVFKSDRVPNDVILNYLLNEAEE